VLPFITCHENVAVGQLHGRHEIVPTGLLDRLPPRIHDAHSMMAPYERNERSTPGRALFQENSQGAFVEFDIRCLLEHADSHRNRRLNFSLKILMATARLSRVFVARNTCPIPP
jgi:hypothetical protein